jgi:hypothetical protein
MVTVIPIEEGLDYILSHFEGQRQWPRTISTKATDNRQVPVNSKKEALARFTQASFLDCRISAYPQTSEVSSFVGVNLDIAPSVIMIDLDQETFKTQRAFEMALSRTVNKIGQDRQGSCLNCDIHKSSQGDIQPTVIWSGSGYHVYLVLGAFVLESVDTFNNSRFGTNPSQKFLRFAEWFLSNGKCDPQHNKTISLRNCMLRVPGSINSKNGQTVRIIQKWNGHRPSIKLLLEDFYVYLCDQRLTELEEKRKSSSKVFNSKDSGWLDAYDSIQWIEKLLQTPLVDHRKLAIWRILVPYLLNFRGLSPDKAQGIVREWLDGCNKIRRLDFNPNHRIKSALNSSKDFLPIGLDKLRAENEGFYNLLQDDGVLTK